MFVGCRGCSRWPSRMSRIFVRCDLRSFIHLQFFSFVYYAIVRIHLHAKFVVLDRIVLWLTNHFFGMSPPFIAPFVHHSSWKYICFSDQITLILTQTKNK